MAAASKMTVIINGMYQQWRSSKINNGG